MSETEGERIPNHGGSASPFRRLIVLHLTMDEICLGGETLDECASEEELSAHILYFSDQRCREKSASSARTGDVLQFAGLCAAMYSLPMSVADCDSDGEADRTQTVHLDESTLMFVPLEDKSLDIIAVAEIERCSDVLKRATPISTRSLIEDCHTLFCLRRGGVHRRLQRPENAKIPSLSSCPYPGMDTLYRLRRKCRPGNQSPSDIKHIESFYFSLPVRSLKQDLLIHYNDFLAGVSHAASQHPSACRSTTVQHCLSLESNPPTNNHLPVELKSSEKNLYTELFSSALQEIGRPLIGFSLFAHNQLVLTIQQNDGDYNISNRTAITLLRYTTELIARSTIAEGVVELAPASGHEESNVTANAWAPVPPPRLSLLGSNDDDDGFQGPQGQRVWMPTFFLSRNAKLSKFQRVTLLRQDKFTMFVYTEVQNSPEKDDQYINLLNNVMAKLTTRATPTFVVRNWQGAGQVVVAVDHARNTVILYTSAVDKPHAVLDTPEREVFALTDRLRRLTSGNRVIFAKKSRPTSTSETDASKQFVSRLPLSSIMALDDSISQADSFRQLQNNEKNFESCTALKNSWMYTSVSGSTDLHALFDPQVHVTVADVRLAAEEIKDSLIG